MEGYNKPIGGTNQGLNKLYGTIGTIHWFTTIAENLFSGSISARRQLLTIRHRGKTLHQKDGRRIAKDLQLQALFIGFNKH